jgi:thioredoxin reductase (NADPH)
LRAVAFPKLSEAQMAALGKCPLTILRRCRDGEKLFAACECDCKFFVVKSGEVALIDESGETPRTVTVHGPGEFAGDVRSGSVKRVASAVGEGAMAVQFVHEYLKEM